MIGADKIHELIPHAGAMSLLDQVVSFDSGSIVCASQSHLSDENPLRVGAKLSALNAIEYGAQAMALHSALSGHITEGSYLVAARDVELSRSWLDDVPGSLQVSATQIMRDAQAAIYKFSVSAEELVLVTGRLTVMFSVETKS